MQSNRLSKILGVSTLLLFIVSSAWAQGGGRRSPEQQRKMQLERDEALVKELGVEEEKAEQLMALLGEAADKQQTLLAEMRAQGSREGFQQMRTKMTEIRAETDEKVKDLLDEEEFAKYQEIRKKQDEQQGQRRRRGRRIDNGQ